MRDRFRGYYPPTEAELEELWEQGLVVLDANALLNLYRYTTRTREDFISTLRGLADRLWLPFQAGLEFQRQRLAVIDQQANAYDAVLKGIEKARASVATEANGYRRHPVLSATDLLAKFDQAVAPLQEELERSRQQHRSIAPASPSYDGILASVTELFGGRVGYAFNEEELAEIFAEGSARYAKHIPPGYKDAGKGEPERYGDLIIWKELLRKGAESGLPLIFVTDDRKEDWWREFNGRTIGPRVELIDEYAALTGRRVHFYVPEQFLRFAKTRSASAVSEASIGEVEAVSQQEAMNRVLAIGLGEPERVSPEFDQVAFLKRWLKIDVPLPDGDLIARGWKLSPMERSVRERDAVVRSATAELVELEDRLDHLDRRLARTRDHDQRVEALAEERDALAIRYEMLRGVLTSEMTMHARKQAHLGSVANDHPRRGAFDSYVRDGHDTYSEAPSDGEAAAPKRWLDEED